MLLGTVDLPRSAHLLGTGHLFLLSPKADSRIHKFQEPKLAAESDAGNLLFGKTKVRIG